MLAAAGVANNAHVPCPARLGVDMSLIATQVGHG